MSLADSTPSIHIKAGTKLAKVSVANKAIVKNAMGALEKAEDGGDKAAAGAVITDVAGTQGTYYHKTGPVPKQTKKAAKAEYGFSSNGTIISFLPFDAHDIVL